jgi:hypothetical protein
MMLRARGLSFERSNSTYGVVRAAVGQIGYERFRRNRVGKTLYSVGTCMRTRTHSLARPHAFKHQHLRPPLPSVGIHFHTRFRPAHCAFSLRCSRDADSQTNTASPILMQRSAAQRYVACTSSMVGGVRRPRLRESEQAV